MRKYLIAMFKLPKRCMSFIIKMIYKQKFGEFHWNSSIISPLHIVGYENIFIKKNVRIQHFSWIQSSPLTGDPISKLIIGDNTTLGHFNHIIATRTVIIGSNVLTADRVYISDNIHDYKDINCPIMNQPIIQKKEVSIGDDSWLGENVCVMGANIGKHCVIGANSVVTKDIPAYSVAVGIPAKIIKRYDFEMNEWRKTDPFGNFINP